MLFRYSFLEHALCMLGLTAFSEALKSTSLVFVKKVNMYHKLVLNFNSFKEKNKSLKKTHIGWEITD